jgi:Flp pilus assembly pilin Flp
MEATPMRIRNGWLARRLRRFARSNEGAAALEFALVLPPLCLILVGMFEVAMLMFTQASMEGALREAGRFGMTGSVEDPADREADIIALVEKYTFNMIDMDEVTITFEVYDSFSDVDQAEPLTLDLNGNGKWDPGDEYDDLNSNGQWDEDIGEAGVGGAEQIVQYTIRYDWHTMTPFMAQFMGDNGTVHLSAAIVIRNEPWEAIAAEAEAEA